VLDSNEIIKLEISSAVKIKNLKAQILKIIEKKHLGEGAAK
jgi:hypothetical protein